MSFSLFDIVECIDAEDKAVYGVMQVVEIHTEEHANTLGSYPIVCRTENLGMRLDFRPAELRSLEDGHIEIVE